MSAWRPAGCYCNPASVTHIQELIDRALAWGFEGYFVDEPPRLECYCVACGRLFADCKPNRWTRLRAGLLR